MSEQTIDEIRQERDQLRAQVAENETKMMRQEAAVAAGLDPEAADRIRGNTRDEMLADAKQFAGDIARVGGHPAPTPSGGSIVARAIAGQARGRQATLAAIQDAGGSA